jgi:hypothetical protein
VCVDILGPLPLLFQGGGVPDRSVDLGGRQLEEGFVSLVQDAIRAAARDENPVRAGLIGRA